MYNISHDILYFATQVVNSFVMTYTCYFYIITILTTGAYGYPPAPPPPSSCDTNNK